MYVIENEVQFIYASVTETGRPLVNFEGLLFSGDDADALLDQLTRATAALRKALDEYNATQEPEPEPDPRAAKINGRFYAATRSVDIEDVNAGDQIRVGGWWHRVETIKERRHGVTVKTTRNEWFAFDHGDRVTTYTGDDNE
jgi:hypothetical protein